MARISYTAPHHLGLWLPCLLWASAHAAERPLDASLTSDIGPVQEESPRPAIPQTAPIFPQCDGKPEYHFIRNNIFDPAEPGFTWLHRWANRFHIVTKKVTLENEVAGFTPCEDNLDDLYELERHMRAKYYLRDAKVTAVEPDQGDTVIQVETWDTWSLLPTIDFSRVGGESEGAIGVKDSNFFGLGIDAQVEYFSDADDEGWLLDIDTPLFMDHNQMFGLRLADTENGGQVEVSLRRPFISANSRTAWGLYFNDEETETTIRQRDDEINEFDVDLLNYQLWFGWSKGLREDWIWRYYLGLTREESQFDIIDDTILLPDDRDRLVPWAQISAYQDDFTKRTNIYLINGFEDINLGYDWALTLGWDTRDAGWQAEGRLSFGLEPHPSWLWLHSMRVEGEEKENGDSHLRINWRQEGYYRLSDPLRLYGKLDLNAIDNPYVDEPLTIGGDSNLRGYPLQYSHGEQTALATAEVRYYPDINLFQLFDLGGAMFYDIGRAWGDSDYPGNPQDTLQAVGVGFRMFPSRSSSARIIHIDVVRTINDDDQVDDWEWRLEVKEHF